MPADPHRTVRQFSLLIASILALSMIAPLSAAAGQDRASVSAERAALREARRARRAGERALRRSSRQAHRGSATAEGGAEPPAETERKAPAESSGETPSPAAPGPPLQSAAPPAGRSGAKSPSSTSGDCHLSLGVGAGVITAGESVAVLGQLACQSAAADAPAAGQSVDLYRREAGTPGFAIVATATVEGDGSFQFASPVFQANSVLYVRSGRMKSRHVAVKVTPAVTFHGSLQDGSQLVVAGNRRSGATAATNNSVTFSGTVTPAQSGTIVALQREDEGASEGWRRIALAEAGPSGEYSLTHSFGMPGNVKVRVVVRHRGNLATASEPLSYEVTRRQNPLLTIKASSNVVADGQPVTISGLAVGAVKQTVTLIAREPSGKLVSVAQSTTDDSGQYAFAPQTPLQSTSYKVMRAGKYSTAVPVRVLFELTAAASADAVQTGQPVTFSGTALPGKEGHPVYLERQNASGIGFHVVETGTLGAGSTYSISHTFFSAGDAAMRIKVPGDPGFVGTGSELLEIHVSPTPSTALLSQLPVS